MLSALVAAAIAGAPLAATAHSPAGTVMGVIDRDIAVYRGIPYARPPVGALRWRAPKPLIRWQGIYQARTFGATCIQVPPRGDAGVGSEPPNEDCLTLNIWAPRERRKLPVMVWIHGGGYINGSGSAPLYEASTLARRGVVVVTFNYRLGRFGFFHHPELKRREGSNFGLLDQQAALRWVKRNIAAFGGDPNRVTLFGNSAGGESVLFHMTSRGSHGLFHRAIVQSGLGGRALRNSHESIDRDRAGTPLASLRALSAADILAWGTPSLYRGFGPTIDGVTIDQPIEAAFGAGRQAPVPMIIGYNGFEFPPAAMGGRAVAAALVGHDESQRRDGIAAYGSIDAYGENIASDALFRAPALRLAMAHAGAGLPTWAYEFDVVSPAASARLRGAPHASERAYVFGTLPFLGWPTDARDAAIANVMGKRWAEFVATGVPATQMEWPRSRATDAAPWLIAYDPARSFTPMPAAWRRYHGMK